MPPDAPPTLGVTQSLFHPLQTSNEASTLQFRTTVTPPQNAVRDLVLFYPLGHGVENAWFHSSFPITGRLEQICSSSDSRRGPATYFPPTRWYVQSNPFPLRTFSLWGQTQPTPSSPPVTALPPDWIKVPQRDYDHGRKQRNFERLAPIFFSVNGRPGINLGDALRKTSTGLDGRDDPVLQEATSTISCRLLVRLLWSSSRPLARLTLSPVPRVSSQQFVPGMSAELLMSSGADHTMEDSRIRLG